MRLYLSSFRLGNRPQEMVKLALGKRAAVIANAADIKTASDRAEAVQYEIDCLTGLGFEPEELDLRDYFGKPDELRIKINDFNLVWVRGGNCFILRRAFKYSGFDELIKEILQQDAMVYAGYSAGIDMLVPSLHGVELVDDPNEVPKGYEAEIIWDCLGLLPYAVAPHYKSDHPESADIDKSVEYLIDNHILFKALRDGEAIVINGDKERIVS